MKNLLPFLVIFFLGCQVSAPDNYKSESLELIRLSDHVYQHITYLDAGEWGMVSCNGILVYDQGEAIIFDTPSYDSVAQELIEWVDENLDAKVISVVPTHFHIDCLGGLNAFHEKEIPSHAYQLTIELAKRDSSMLPMHGFEESKNFQLGNINVEALFLGEGHTMDNIIAYVPSDQLIFGGCLVKSVGASKGNLSDANVEVWPFTIKNIMEKYPEAEVIVPGHGKPGNQELLEYTMQLFSND